MLPVRFYAVAVIALAPILDAMGTLSHFQAWLMMLAGGAWLLFWTGVVFDKWLHRQERRPPRRKRVARVRRTGKALVIR